METHGELRLCTNPENPDDEASVESLLEETSDPPNENKPASVCIWSSRGPLRLTGRGPRRMW